MTELTLRAYVREIDGLIEHEKLDEAIAHARHILQRYPKYIECYRLLGKAYLEAKRYGDAADIFQRVLSAVPDDFVSHIGMSIVREDEGNLDSAIWHMERAFETNPANPAIQQELKRLIGRRDGFEPHKVRLTRGALARMYAHGELYPQAIAELQSALQEDAERPDLQVLLADMYWQTDQRREAAEVSGRILEKLPFCVKATRIMAAMLLETGKAEEAAAYHRRLAQLDPYMAYIETPMADTGRVDAETIELRRLAWRPGQPLPATDSAPTDWAASLGLEPAEGEEISTGPLPSWLSEIEPDEDQAPAQPTPAPSDDLDVTEDAEAEAQADIPDWMQEAGWQESSGEAVEQPVAFSAEELDSLERGQLPDEADATEEAGEVELARAEIPGWLQGLAPGQTGEAEDDIDEDELASLLQREPGPDVSGALEFETEAVDEEAEASDAEAAAEVPGWLDEGQPGATSTIMTWLGDRSREPDEPEETDRPAEPAAEEIPDWMATADKDWGSVPDDQAEPEPEGPPTWLSGVAKAAAGATQADEEELARLRRMAQSETDGAESGGTDELPPDWLQAIARDEPAPPAEPAGSDVEIPWEAQVEAAEQDTIPQGAEEDAPDWLMGFGEGQPEGGAESEIVAEATQEDDDTWLAGLGTDQEEDRAQEASSWLERLGTDQEVEASAAPGIPDWMEGLGDEVDGGADEVEELASTWLDNLSDTLAETPSEPEVLDDSEFERQLEAKPEEGWLTAGAGGEPEIAGEPEADEEQDLSWLERLVPTADSQPAAAGREQPEPASAADIEPSDVDSVFGWMDQMAADRAAEAEERPSDASQSAPPEPTLDAVAPPESLDEGLEWLDRLSETRGIDADIDREPAPGTVSQARQPEPASEQPASPPEESWPPAPPAERPAPIVEERPAEPADIGPWESEPAEAEPAAEPVGWEDAPEPAAELGPAPVPTEPEQEESEIPEWLRAHADPAPLEADNELEPVSPPAPPPVPPPAAETIVARQAPPSGEPAARPAASQPPSADPGLQTARQALAGGDRYQAASAYGKLVKAKRQIETVVADLEAELKRDPDSPQLWQVLGDAYMRQNRAKDAVRAYNRGMEETEVLDSARQALAAGDVNRAITQYGMLIKQKTELDSVIDDLETATTSGESVPMVWQTLGDAYMKAGRVDDSIKAYRRGMDSV